jgi:hypothetical protein
VRGAQESLSSTRNDALLGLSYGAKLVLPDASQHAGDVTERYLADAIGLRCTLVDITKGGFFFRRHGVRENLVRP